MTRGLLLEKMERETVGALDLFNIGLDGYSALLCAVMGAHALMGVDRRDVLNRLFAGMCFANVAMALGDMTSWAPAPPLDAGQYALVAAGSLLYYVAVVPVYACFIAYVVACVSRRAPLSARTVRVGGGVLAVLLGAYLFMCVASLKTGWFFAVTPEGGYARGNLFWVCQVAVVALHLCNAALIVWAFPRLNAVERWSFASYIVLPAVADVFQVFSFGVAVLNAAVSFALVILFIGIQSERKALLARREQELTQAQADLMLSQIQPHFLYNTLTAIRQLCLRDPAEAARTVADFSAFLRENMASLSSRAPIPFERELAHARTYLALEGKRFGKRLRVEYDIRATDFALPPLSLQVIVENAVRHGVTCREEGGTVRVSAVEEPDAFAVTVEDDGVGFDASAAPADGKLHVGVANVRSRVEALCGGTLTVESVPGVGTWATIRVPKGEGGAGRAHHGGR